MIRPQFSLTFPSPVPIRLEREWATALLNQVLDRLEGDYLASGRRKVFETLQPLLLDRKGDRPCFAGLQPAGCVGRHGAFELVA